VFASLYQYVFVIVTLARRLMTTMIDVDMVNNAGIAQCYYQPTGESQEFNSMPKFLYAI